MNNIILTLLSIHRIGRKSVDYFITSMKEVAKNEKRYSRYIYRY